MADTTSNSRRDSKKHDNVFNLIQKEASEKLGVTSAVVSQYLSGKRGKMEIIDEEILEEIKRSTKRIIEEGEKVVVQETCSYR